MAQIIVENRTFKDRETGITTDYKYYAIKGGKAGKIYEVPLKGLTGAEKSALEMIADAETPNGEIVSRKASEDEKPTVSKTSTDGTILDDDEDNKSWFGK